jgi:hypothetical protein
MFLRSVTIDVVGENDALNTEENTMAAKKKAAKKKVAKKKATKKKKK